MSSKEEQYKEMFLSEAHENFEELNSLFTGLESNTSNKEVINAIFRITHTIKGNAMGMGFMAIGELAHVMEDLFSEIKSGNLTLDSTLFQSLFKANDKLGELIEGIKNNNPNVQYKGIKTKLEIVLKKAKEKTAPTNENKTAPTQALQSDTTDLSETTSNKATEEDDTSVSKLSFSDMVSIPVKKLDVLLNQVGELIIEKDSLISRSLEREGSVSELSRLHRITSDLQYSIMDIRLVQIGFLFNKFKRIVRDAASVENKKVELITEGTEIEIDRNILKIISDALVHLVRNSVGHGIEKPEVRHSISKPETGKVYLKARNEKETVIIEVQDDGAGIDANRIKEKIIQKGLVKKEIADKLSTDQILQFIFEPGFSSADQINEISGRGVGMDVVKRTAESIGGKVDIVTKVGQGTSIILHLPSSMSLKGALLFIQNDQEFAMPLTYTESVVSLNKSDIHRVSEGLICTYLGHNISLVFLSDLFMLNKLGQVNAEGKMYVTFDKLPPDARVNIIIVSYNHKLIGFVVDKLLQQKEIVEKPLSNPLDNIEMFSGATILGNGNVCLVMDVVSILREFFQEKMTLN
ncbi:MAG: chemotaxis protein CheA [Bacteroidia bacterium]|nr:chemotaxis protein CheA [Bacteroidia bacterium]